MDAQQYLAERVDERIEWYEQTSRVNLRWYRWLRGAEVMGAACIPLVAGYALISGAAAVVVGILGIVVAVTAGILGLYQFPQKYLEARAVSQALRKEKYLYSTRTAPYDSDHDVRRLRRLVRRVENIVADEESGWRLDRFAPNIQSGRTGSEQTDPLHAAAE